ncbi:hypothetical protein ACWKX5_06560 [Enterobacter asburiae]
MSNIDKQAVQLVADLKAGYTLGHADVEIIQQMALDAVTLMGELEAKDKRLNEIITPNMLLPVIDDMDADNLRQGIKTASENYSLLHAKWEAAEKRIAELEASHGKLREAIAGIHNTISGAGTCTPLAAILNASKRAYEESAAAAGKGE